MSKGKILFQLTGSIACFKACALLSRLVKDGFEVEVVATKSAVNFVGAATLEGLTGRRVHVDTFADGAYMNHIHLERWADLLLLCPATANTINKLAGGIGDDLVSTLFLAHDFKKPYVVAPAMNEKMLQHPATQASLRRLADWGVTVLGSGDGALACGESGDGRLLEPDELYREVLKSLATRATTGERSAMRRRTALVTAGGTREPIDGVRAIANTSTGRTGTVIAQRLAAVGYDVTLVRAADTTGPEPKMAHIRELTFVTFNDLREALRSELGTRDYDAVIHAAAVGDFAVDAIEGAAGADMGDRAAGAGTGEGAARAGKIESDGEVILKLKRNPKLVDELRKLSRNPKTKIIAFKLTSSTSIQEREDAVRKLIDHAHPDFVVLNDAGEINATTHPTRIFSSPGMHEVQRSDTKQGLAEAIGRLLETEAV